MWRHRAVQNCNCPYLLLLKKRLRFQYHPVIVAIKQEETKVSLRPGLNQKCQEFLLKGKTRHMRSSMGPEVIARRCRGQNRLQKSKKGFEVREIYIQKSGQFLTRKLPSLRWSKVINVIFAKSHSLRPKEAPKI